MNEKIPDTLFELFNEYDVEVPIIQRDYAQGRQDDHAKMVRSNLLNDIKLAISGKTQPLDLNFVYGKAEENKFIPIDGQQRLTTLFLLHLFLCVSSGCNVCTWSKRSCCFYYTF